jgi:hypothetical protein
MAGRPLRGIPGDEEFIRNLSHAVGHLAVHFGLFEFSLNGTIAVIHQTVAQPVSSQGELPFPLKERLRYVRTAAKLSSALQPYRSELMDLMVLAKRLSKTRNGVLHGYPGDYDPPTRTFTFVSLGLDRPDKSMHRAEEFVVSFPDLIDHGARAEELAARMAALCHRLADEVAP